MSTAISRLQSRWGVLALSAILDLVVRLPEDILAPSLSLIGGVLGNPTVAFLTTWFMIAAAFYTFAPLAYSYLTVLPTRSCGFRAIFAGGTLPLGLMFQRSDSLGLLAATAFGTVLLTTTLFLGYLSVRHQWTLLDPDGQAAELMKTFSPREDDVAEEIKTDLAYEGFLGHAAALLYLLAIGTLLCAPVVIAAIVSRVIIYAYPIPDIVFLGWATSAHLFPRLAVGPDRQRVLNLEFDLERFLVDFIENATRSFFGFFSSVFLVLGLFTAAGYVFIGIAVASALLPTVANGLPVLLEAPTTDLARRVWNLSGVVILILFAGCYGIWAWIRTIRRLPHYLDVKEGRDTVLQADLISRPPGLVLAPTAAWLLAVLYVYSDGPLLATVYAVAWPATLLGGVWTVWWTRRRTAQPATTEYRWILFALVLQMWSVWLAGRFPQFVGALTSGSAVGSVLILPVAVTLLLAVVAIVPVIFRYESRHEDYRRYTFVWLLLGLGILALAARPVIPSQYSVLAWVLGFLGLVFAPALAIVRFYEI
jgi:hypothetical protein